MVRMQHATLPAGQDIEVAEISVAAYERMGWTVVGGRQPSKTAAASGRRRTQKENS
ncbi:hypothetical protein ACFYNN_12880 [Streptomyces sp. NPDC006978]|uniref:hypothetical protein n=1 Tax=Streptomyces sp. NPDC006978 TaxID=3364769 RepID=UPI00367FC554